ncbi:MAG: polysaccharide biosynthesis protein [uncultured Gemmatimonadaceae bacterium]|uniref:Polysaccharide biosynthesis protein n=1 Tax=uncultured Gemmatimonadaceae bacterium TaxID=246130 RepID=A0A6J4MIF2_9BACT|nr:MAG: polysaccharide biosynthesis protein [uncultured Gemmatimonadaceae bacterium]
MSTYLRRLLSTGAAYQVADVVSKVIALALLPVYTRELTRADYGTAELLLTVVILGSIVVRLGVGEALVRFHYHDEDPARRRRLARTATGVLLLTTTLVAGLAAIFATPVSEWILGSARPAELRAAALGLWAFTNLELANALLRVDERGREYAIAALTNVALTVAFTLYLVVVRDLGALGLLLGNFGASAVVLLGLWVRLRDALGPVDGSLLPGMLRFGLPTVPAEVSVFALFFVDRLYLYRVAGEAEAGLYSLSIKLAAVVIFTVRAFQLAWPPLAYSITDDGEARRVYARVTTYYVLFTGLVVAALTLLGRWVVRLLAAPEFYPAHEALPWVSLGWALYGLFLVLVAMAGRAQVTVRNVPAALCGLAANVVLLLLLVEPLGIAGAGIALCGAYAVMLVAMYALTRSLFRVDFEWRRLVLAVAVLAAITVAAELLAPTEGAGGFALRALALAVLPAALRLAGFFEPGELRAARGVVRRRTVAKV